MIMARTVREPSAEEWEDIARDLYDLVCDEVGWDTEPCEQYREVRAKAERARRP
jgi:hypothetical protein